MIRQIHADEWKRLKALRLQALADAPTAFGSTLEAEVAFPDSVWQERAAAGAAGFDRVTFVAEEDDRWIGTATGRAFDPAEPDPTLVAMFVVIRVHCGPCTLRGRLAPVQSGGGRGSPRGARPRLAMTRRATHRRPGPRSNGTGTPSAASGDVRQIRDAE